MKGFYDYIKNYCICKGQLIYISLRDITGVEASSWPLPVYNVNGELIGTANNKEEFILLWNANQLNRDYGTMINFFGPFTFMILIKPMQFTSEISGLYSEKYSIVYE